MTLGRCVIAVLLLGPFAAAFCQTHEHTDHSQHPPPATTDSSASGHVPPDAPAHSLGPMSSAEMIEMMAMDDAARYGNVVVDQLEWREHDDAFGWEASAWYGGDYNKLLIESEGIDADDGAHARNERCGIT